MFHPFTEPLVCSSLHICLHSKKKIGGFSGDLKGFEASLRYPVGLRGVSKVS